MSDICDKIKNFIESDLEFWSKFKNEEEEENFKTSRKIPNLSIGVILFRRNLQNKNIECLLVKKRYTYAYAEFVNGNFSMDKKTIAKPT